MFVCLCVSVSVGLSVGVAVFLTCAFGNLNRVADSFCRNDAFTLMFEDYAQFSNFECRCLQANLALI